MIESDRGAVVGSYRLERRLGQGAMGEVWLAHHVRTGAPAAVKRLRDRPGLQARLGRFFDNERRIVSRLSHPHVVALFEVGPDHLATAYVDGSDLARRLATPVEPALAVQLVRQIASALAYAHDAGVVHRDVKPGNILLDRRGNAFLADFGLATLAGEAADGHVAGTVGYMAPEQAAGEPAGPAADQYALARTLLEALVGGRLPPDREAALALLPAALPTAARDALVRALAQRPEARWPTIAAFADALAAVDLGDYAPPSRLAPEVRVRAPFAWTAGAERSGTLGLDIARLDFRLTALERRGLVPGAACARFRRETGHADFGWALFGRTARLGALDQAHALARAAEVVVLLHGWLCTREVWSAVAGAICRDNAQTVVLAPDVGGFGVSRFVRRTPALEHTTPPAIVHAVLSWLELLGLRPLPTVLVGHSMSAVNLLAAPARLLGPQTARLALAPVFPFADAAYRRRLRFGAVAFRALGWLTPLKRHLGASAIKKAPAAADLTPESRERLYTELLRTPSGVLARVPQGMLDARPVRGADLANCVVVLGANDPLLPDRVAAEAVRALGVPATTVGRLATGGHYPHLESASHPEWTARNVAHIAALVDGLLIACREGSVVSTEVASTAHSGDAGS